MPSKRHLTAKLPLILILPVLLFSLVFVSLAVDTDDFSHRHNLSRTGRLDNLQSSPPKMVSNGNTIVAVWSDGFEGGNPNRTKDFGNIYLASARETDGYWRAKLKVFDANFSNWGTNPAVVFDRTTPNRVHIVWAEGSDCTNSATAESGCPLRSIKYRQCDVSGNINFCLASPQVVASGGGSNVTRFNPQIVMDGDTDLHVVWSQRTGAVNKVFYSRNGGSGWSTPTEVAAAAGGQDAQLWASPNRLHLVWDDIAANRIKYLFDTNHDDSSLSASGGVKEFRAGASPYSTGNPGNPTITGRGNWLFIAFDVENPGDEDEFALFYTMSANQGDTWPLVYNIPDQNIISVFNHLSSPVTDRALKPSLVVTSTGTATRLHAVWHERVPVKSLPFPVSEYRVRFSDLDLSQPLNPNTPKWSAPISVTHILDPAGRATTDPKLIITNPALGASGEGHIVYLEEANLKNSNQDIRQLDVFYEGGISGTIDPAYILDEFSGGQGGTANPLDIKGVEPTFIKLEPGQTSGIRAVLNYTIRFKNLGDLDAIGIGITDTLPVEVDYNGDLQTVITPPGGSAAVYNSGSRQITWYGDVPPGTEISISFSVTTNDNLRVPANVQNTVDMWNLGTGGQPIVDPDQPNCPGGTHTDCANTILAITIIYLPVINR